MSASSKPLALPRIITFLVLAFIGMCIHECMQEVTPDTVPEFPTFMEDDEEVAEIIPPTMSEQDVSIIKDWYGRVSQYPPSIDSRDDFGDIRQLMTPEDWDAWEVLIQTLKLGLDDLRVEMNLNDQRLSAADELKLADIADVIQELVNGGNCPIGLMGFLKMIREQAIDMIETLIRGESPEWQQPKDNINWRQWDNDFNPQWN